MGKKSKKALEQPAEQSHLNESIKEADAADDDALIPYHTKQASFALLYLLLFSFLMFTLPFFAFYATRHMLREYFHLDTFDVNAWSVLAAVLTVNIVIAMYAIFGFIDAKKEETTVKDFAKKAKDQ